MKKSSGQCQPGAATLGLRFIILWRSAAAARGLRRDSAYCKAIIHEAESSGECGWAPRRAQVGARGRHTLFESPPLPLLQVSLRRLLNNWINNLRTGVGFEAPFGCNSELPFGPDQVDGNRLLILSPASLSQKIQRTMATWDGNRRFRNRFLNGAGCDRVQLWARKRLL